MDVTSALAPKSDQLDFADLDGGPDRIFTITAVRKGSAEQPVEIDLAEFPRVWRPSVGMARVLHDAWGKETDNWVGKQVELYGDPTVMFGKERVGGTRIRRLSHIDGPRTTRTNPRGGPNATWTVKPLPSADPAAEMVAAFEQRAGINRANLEAHIGRPVTEWTTEDLANLRTLGGQIARGEKTVEDVFGAGES